MVLFSILDYELIEEVDGPTTMYFRKLYTTASKNHFYFSQQFI